MIGYIVRRVATGIVLVLAVSVVTFLLLYASGADIARNLLGANATPEAVEQKASELGLDRPLVEQYWSWLTSALTGDLGRSWFDGQLVSVSLAARLPVTLSIVIGAILVSAIVAVVLGIVAARRGGWIDGSIQFASLVGFAIPGFLVALVLVLVFAIGLGWFKATGYTPITTSFGGWVASVTLPIVALSVAAIANVAQQVRGSVIDAMSRDYVRTLRSRGLGINRVVYRHVLRNAAGPALAVLAVLFVGMIGGAVIIEQMFALPGIGQYAVAATPRGDMPAVMGTVVVTAIVVVIVNLLIDLAQAGLNPKVRLS